jgi:hypothetical protein
MRRIVLRSTQLLDMQYLNPQVRLVLAAAVGLVTPGDLVNTLRYGRWQVRTVDPFRVPGATTISVIAELIEDTVADRPPSRDVQ